MATSDNLYAPPKASLTLTHSSQALWRDGKVLVADVDAVFPDRCIKCNDPAQPETKRVKLRWHSSGWYLLVLLNIVFYAIAAAIVTKKAEVQIGLCERHQRRVLIGKIIGWGGFALLALIFAIAFFLSSSTWAVIGGLALLPWCLATVLVSRLIYAQRIDKTEIRIRGCGKDFLDSLPEYRR